MRPMLGTYVEIQVEGLDDAAANDAIEAAFAAVDEVDRLLSSHRPDSELNAINAAAGRCMVSVSPWTRECIEAAIQVGRQSGGEFDITCRPLLDLWGFVRKEYRLPDKSELRAALPLVNFQDILILRNNPAHGRERCWIGLPRIGMKLDVGGIGKGFAVDKAVEALKEAGVASGLVRAGGDLCGFGPHPWKVGIANPSDPRRAVNTFEIMNEAVSTSGDYENFFEIRGHRYTHIINPRTGWPVAHVRSFSVHSPTCTQSDAWSTALFVNPKLKPPGSIRVADMR